jgi:hypothetical protein
VSRKLVIPLVVVLSAVVLLGGALVVRSAVHRLAAKDSSPEQRAVRERLDAIEGDSFFNALLAVPHSTQGLQESLVCRAPQAQPNWNLRVVASGGLDLDRVDALLDEPQSFGWTAAGSGIARKAIEPGVVVDLVAVVDGDSLVLTANVSAGLDCSTARASR